MKDCLTVDSIGQPCLSLRHEQQKEAAHGDPRVSVSGSPERNVACQMNLLPRCGTETADGTCLSKRGLLPRWNETPYDELKCLVPSCEAQTSPRTNGETNRGRCAKLTKGQISLVFECGGLYQIRLLRSLQNVSDIDTSLVACLMQREMPVFVRQRRLYDAETHERAIHRRIRACCALLSRGAFISLP